MSVAEAAYGLFARRRREDPVEEERRELLEGMAETRRQLNLAYHGFNTHSDPDLIESYVYEINALQSRYSYLVRRVKDLEHQEREERRGRRK